MNEATLQSDTKTWWDAAYKNVYPIRMRSEKMKLLPVVVMPGSGAVQTGRQLEVAE